MDKKNITTDAAPRKVRFKPTAPPRKVAKPAIVKKEETNSEADAIKAKELLRRFKESSFKGKPKFEKKVTHIQDTSSSIRSYGTPNYGSTYKGADPSSLKPPKEYREPWDYYTNYPVCLPMRRPYAGEPELLDEEEFGEESQNTVYEEDSINPSIELGLEEENEENSIFFLQLPASMPMIKRSATADGTKSNVKTSKGTSRVEKPCRLDELPAGLMGKMLVYKSGAVKLQLGDTLYDVSPSLNCEFAQDVAAINTEEKNCYILGGINKRALVVPDIDSILERIADL